MLTSNTTTTTTNIISHHNILNNDQYQYLTNYQQPDLTKNIYIPYQKADRIASTAMHENHQQNESNNENGK
jgi:hypothetical protein